MFKRSTRNVWTSPARREIRRLERAGSPNVTKLKRGGKKKDGKAGK